MSRKLLAVTGFVAVVLGTAVWAAESKEDEAKEHADARKGLAKAKVTMSQAIATALGKVPNGKAVEAELELEGDDVEFEIEIIADGKHHEVEIDAVTGAVKEVKEESEKGEDEKAEDAAAKAAITLQQALEIAQKSVPNGKAFEAEPEMEDGKLIWEVEFIAGDKVMEVEVDATTGKVLEVEEEK